jgi:hypothetical protein
MPVWESLEIALYFDEWTDLGTQKLLGREEVAEVLSLYPFSYFQGNHDVKLDYGAQRPRGLFVLYNRLVGEPQIRWLEEQKAKGYIQSWGVFPPGSWRDYFEHQRGGAS